jgi:transcriptional regulator with XRE-family HTH domain
MSSQSPDQTISSNIQEAPDAAAQENISAELIVGMKIRKLRTQRRLSLRKLAELSGLNINTLSMVENGKSSPSIATLQQLARALEAPIAAFFETEPTPKKVVFTSLFRRREAQMDHARMENLGKGLAGNVVQPFVVTLEKDADSGDHMIVHTGHEFVYVLSGRIMYVIDDQPYLLAPGESLVFESHLPHRWKNIGEGEAQIILVLYPADIREDPGGHHFDLEK